MKQIRIKRPDVRRARSPVEILPLDPRDLQVRRAKTLRRAASRSAEVTSR